MKSSFLNKEYVPPGMLESRDGHLDKEIETFIAASRTSRKSSRTCSSQCKLILKKLITFTPLFVSLGYLIYVGFALYSDPELAVAVTVFTPLVLYVCVNRFTRGRFSKGVSRILGRFCGLITPRKRIRLWSRRLLTVGGVLGVIAALVVDIWDDFERFKPAGGLAILLILAVVFSKAPRKINWTSVTWGILLQFCLGFVILRWKVGFHAFQWLGVQVTSLLAYTDAGTKFVFGKKYTDHPIVFKILPVLVFFGALTEVLYYVGAMQAVIKSIASLLQFAMITTPIESFATAAHIFIGQLESSVALKPFFLQLTTSELHAVMTSGFATIAGSMFAATIEFGIPPEHLVSASFMSAPAALAMAKISIPETERSSIRRQKDLKVPLGNATNLIEALANGSTTTIKLISYVVVNLIAFMATLAFLDAVLSYLGDKVGYPGLSFQLVCSYIFYPFAVIVGIPLSDALQVGSIYGKKIIMTEFLAYIELGEKAKSGLLQGRSLVLGTYMLCGFGSLTSIGIYLGALVSAVPQRRNDFADLSLRGLIYGNIACLMTTCIAGLLYHPDSLKSTLGLQSNVSTYNTTSNSG